MKRRRLIASGSAGVLLGACGCLDEIGPAGENEDEIDPDEYDFEYECSRFEGLFGQFSIAVPRDAPEDVQVVDLADTNLLTHEEIADVMETAREERADAEEELDQREYLPSTRVSWTDLGNGTLYEAVDDELSAFEPADTQGAIVVVVSNVQQTETWYVTYEDEVYRVTLRHSVFPLLAPNTGSQLEITTLDSDGSGENAIDGEEELIAESEYFLDVLEAARCSRERYDLIEREVAANLSFSIAVNEAHILTDIIDMNETNELVVAYGGEYYRLELYMSDP